MAKSREYQATVSKLRNNGSVWAGNTIDNLAKTVDQKDIVIGNQAARLATLNDEISSVRKTLSNQSLASSQINAQKDGEIIALKNSFNELAEKTASLERDLERSRQSEANLNSQVTQLQSELTRLGDSNKQQSMQMNEKQNEIARLLSDITRLNDLNAQLLRQKQDLSAEKAELIKKKTELLRQIDQLNINEETKTTLSRQESAKVSNLKLW